MPKLLQNQKFLQIKPASYYSDLAKNKLSNVQNIEEHLIDLLKKIETIDNLEKQPQQDYITQILKFLVAKTSGDFTLMFRISQISKQNELAMMCQQDQVLVSEGQWVFKCKIGIIDYDVKYCYQIEQWVKDRQEAIQTLSKQQK